MIRITDRLSHHYYQRAWI